MDRDSPESPLENDRELWYRWTPERAKQSDIARAVHEFQSIDTPAGHAAATWLKERSLAAHGSVVTWLMMLDQQLEGFYAIAGSQVRLTQRHRATIAPNATAMAPTQPASLILFMARHRDGRVPGRKLMLHATYVALQVAKLQGNIALVFEAYDEETASALLANYPFRRGVRESDREPLRLWMPIVEPQAS